MSNSFPPPNQDLNKDHNQNYTNNSNSPGNLDSADTPNYPDNSDYTNNVLSNTSNPNSKIHLLNKLLDIISSDRFLNLLRSHPRLGNIIIVISFFALILYLITSLPNLQNIDIPIIDNILNKTKNEEEMEVAERIMPEEEIEFAEEIMPLKDYDKFCTYDGIKEQIENHAETRYKYKENPELRLEIGKLKLDKEGKKRYPVFRWECHYEIIDTNENDPHSSPIEDKTGLNLDEFCKKNSVNSVKNFPTAAYRNYNDPHSFFCVNAFPNENLSKENIPLN